MSKKIMVFLMIGLLVLTTAGAFARNFTLKNNGTTTLSIKYLCGATGATASWSLAAGASVVHSVADGTAAIRYWADTGSNSPACNSLAEFTLNGAGGLDFYDISLVDGFNVAIQIIPSGGSGNGTKYSCGTAGCTTTALVANCPAELKLNGACCSACMIYGSPQYCCAGSYNTPATCPATTYSNYFKTNCPDAYSYAYDDTTSTYTCTGPSYTINFAGAGNTSSATATPTRAATATATPTRAANATATPTRAATATATPSGSTINLPGVIAASVGAIANGATKTWNVKIAAAEHFRVKPTFAGSANSQQVKITLKGLSVTISANPGQTPFVDFGYLAAGTTTLSVLAQSANVNIGKLEVVTY